MDHSDKHPLPETDIWMVRAGRGGVDAPRFLDQKMAAIGWDVGILDLTTPDEVIKDRINVRYSDEKPGTRRSWAGQVIRFFKEVSIGDIVTTHAVDNRLYHIGIIRSKAEPKIITADEKEMREYARAVDWLYEVPRDGLTAGTRNSLDGLMTVFRVSREASAELRTHCLGDGIADSADSGITTLQEESGTGEILEEYNVKAEGLVEDQIAKLDWRQLQELVAGILRAMGYKTKISARGPDRGVDIFASPDGLGLIEPRIFVEVKHRGGAIGSQQIRSFTGGRKPGDRCLYVSTGGFSMEARYEADRSSIPLTLITMLELRELLLDHYDSLDSETRALVPLKRVYLPIAE